ncbi:porin [Thioalkalivibrio sp. ALM2T]|uniref:porin n=1 Tax=Thioalkalivibrio sp. ALM2T TaxID=1158184 RepID=UPI00036D69E5|nr:porin [Thioalkalivibrio sp. ALM2T]
MNRKQLLTSLVAAGLLAPAIATADWTIYGRANISVDYLDNGADYSEPSLVSNSSRLGFKGEHEFRDQLVAIFQIEQGIDFDADDDLTLATRDTFAGLKGDSWGMFRVGEFDTPFKRARGPANFFGDQLGDMRNLTKATGFASDNRFENGLHYRTPSFGGLTWDVHYSPQTGGASTSTTESGRPNEAFSTSLSLGMGDFTGALAYETRENANADDSSDGWRLASGYKITNAINVGALYQTADNFDGVKSDTYGIGTQIRVAPDFYLKGHVFQHDSDIDQGDATLVALGLEYRVDSNLRFHGTIASVSNDDAINRTPYSDSRTADSTAAGVNGETASGISIGMRYDF